MSRTRRRARIGLTPLIDVVFLLLIFFMLAGHLAASDLFRVEPPCSEAASVATGAADPITEIRLLFSADGRLSLDGAPIDREALGAAMVSRLAESPAVKVILKADGSAEAGAVVALMENLREADITDLQLYAPVETVELREEEPQSAPTDVAVVIPEAVLAESPDEVVEEVIEAVAAQPAMATPVPPPVKPAPPVEAAAPPEVAAEPLPEPVETAAVQAQESDLVAPAATAMASDAPAAGNPGDQIDYVACLLDWLRKHKEYPRRAQLRAYEGTAWLTFAIDREGHLLEYSIDEGTGHSMLDNEVVAMIKRASPPPAPPPDGGKNRFVYRVPVDFGLD